MDHPTTGAKTWFVTGASRGLGLALVTRRRRARRTADARPPRHSDPVRRHPT